MSYTVRAADLPVGSQIEHAGITVEQHAPNGDGVRWTGTDGDSYYEDEVDWMLANGGEVKRVGAGDR